MLRDQPGLSFRGVVRATDIPAGASGVLAAVACGLDENPRSVFELVRELVPCHQKPLLEAGQALLGLPRSTTQHTLLRLEDYGPLALGTWARA